MTDNQGKEKPVTIMNHGSSNWYIPCQYDNMYKETNKQPGELGVDSWRPSSEEVVRMFDRIEKEGGMALNWICLGRRPPTPKEDEEYETDEEEQAAKAKQNEPQEDNKSSMDFDFEDEASTTPKMAPRRPLGQRELKGSARKKTTSLDNVLSNMRRHRQMDAARAAAEASKNAQKDGGGRK